MEITPNRWLCATLDGNLDEDERAVGTTDSLGAPQRPDSPGSTIMKSAATAAGAISTAMGPTASSMPAPALVLMSHGEIAYANVGVAQWHRA